MLSYQHAYHAGNAADVHKHALLALALDHLVQKDKALTYLETHAGRGLYDLTSDAARKTAEARQGVDRFASHLPDAHPYRRALTQARMRHGERTYPGSPLVAQTFLRPFDTRILAELHPQEFGGLQDALRPHPNVHLRQEDGYAMLNAMCPPTPRRGLALLDPSWEVKAEYDRVARLLPKIARKWNVGVLMLWYPLLRDARHRPMLATLTAALPDAMQHEVRFPPARDGHGMVGSGMFIVNPPWGLRQGADQITHLFEGRNAQ